MKEEVERSESERDLMNETFKTIRKKKKIRNL
jgi:hypothetical protein